jgi:4-hydroxy 2-oxovalerate aldolase
METLKVLDVTLRDGGYKNNFKFTNEFVRHVLVGLDASGMDYIEVGYRNGSFKPMQDMGAAGTCPKTYLELCRKNIVRSKLTVMLHPKNITSDDIKEMHDCGVDSVRICFPANDYSLGIKAIDMIKRYGMEFFTNITRASQYTRNELIHLVAMLAKHHPLGIYLADSNGSLTPEEVGNLFMHLGEVVSVPLGFHAHDNLFSAQANAISAIKHGVRFIDASLYGLGKGAGNLRTEGFISYLCSMKMSKYDLCSLLDAANLVKAEFSDEGALSSKDIIMGVFDLSQDDAAKLGSFSNINEYYRSAKEYSEEIGRSHE